jgi:hypothetical protein
MRWGYKTVQYGMKKEGLLGNFFLDEAEIEQSLNEFGQAGWELVSLFAMQDGLMAVFKQPLETQAMLSAQKSVIEENAGQQRFSLKKRQAVDDSGPAVKHVQDRREPAVSEGMESDDNEEGAGGIRIE